MNCHILKLGIQYTIFDSSVHRVWCKQMVSQFTSRLAKILLWHMLKVEHCNYLARYNSGLSKLSNFLRHSDFDQP